jgi:hypothetical protein
MSSLRDFIRRYYVALPVIRELRWIAKTLLETRDDVKRIAVKELVELLQFAIPNHPRYGDPLRLIRYSNQVFSQNGEDGIIAEICRRVGAREWNFLEIGVGDGLENITTALLTRGWSGWWVDGNDHSIARIRQAFRRQLADGTLTVQRANVTA